MDPTLIMDDNLLDAHNSKKSNLYLKCVDTGNVHFLKFGTNKIGRSPENDISIPDSAFVSTFHAQIDVEGSPENYLLFLSDLRSTNKTKLGNSHNESIITLHPQTKYQLRLHDHVVFGQYRCVLLATEEGRSNRTPPLSPVHTATPSPDFPPQPLHMAKPSKVEETKHVELKRAEPEKVPVSEESASTHLSENKKEQESDDTMPYTGECKVREASPSFFEKLESEVEEMVDSDLDFEEEIGPVGAEGKGKAETEKERMQEIEELLRESSEEVIVGAGKQKAVETSSFEKEKQVTSPFTVPVNSLSTQSLIPLSPQKRAPSGNNAAEELTFETQSLSPNKRVVVSPQRDRSDNDLSESATLPLDVPSPQKTPKRKNQPAGEDLDSFSTTPDLSPAKKRKSEPSNHLSPKALKKDGKKKKGTQGEEEQLSPSPLVPLTSSGSNVSQLQKERDGDEAEEEERGLDKKKSSFSTFVEMNEVELELSEEILFTTHKPKTSEKPEISDKKQFEIKMSDEEEEEDHGKPKKEEPAESTEDVDDIFKQIEQSEKKTSSSSTSSNTTSSKPSVTTKAPPSVSTPPPSPPLFTSLPNRKSPKKTVSPPSASGNGQSKAKKGGSKEKRPSSKEKKKEGDDNQANFYNLVQNRKHNRSVSPPPSSPAPKIMFTGITDKKREEVFLF